MQMPTEITIHTLIARLEMQIYIFRQKRVKSARIRRGKKFPKNDILR